MFKKIEILSELCGILFAQQKLRGLAKAGETPAAKQKRHYI
ncbi:MULTISPECIES: hypothetical protein [Bacillus]|nr:MULTISPECIES: hypothetical protein [Bacillus]